MKKVLFLFVLAIAVSLNISTAFATSGNDVSITATTTTSGTSIESGETVTFNFEVTNVGTTAWAPYMATNTIYSSDLTYVNVTSQDYTPVEYKNAEIKSSPELGLSLADKYQDYWLIATGYQGNPTPTLNPGDKLRFQLNFTANKNITDGSTLLIALLMPYNSVDSTRETEFESDSQYQALTAPYTTGGDPLTLSTNNVWSYTYSTAQSTNTTSPSSQQSQSNSTKSQVKSETAVNNGNAASSQAGADITSDPKTTKLSDKANIALGPKYKLPKRVTAPVATTKHSIIYNLTEKKTLAALISAFVLFNVLYLLRRKYVKKVKQEKQYRKALHMHEQTIAKESVS